MATPSIGSAEINEAAGWMLGDPAPGDGRRVEEWGDAREVDIAALVEFAREEATATLAGLEGIGTGQLHAAMTYLAFQGFLTGVEAERRRRDAQVLPS